jgi:heme exporter protein B
MLSVFLQVIRRDLLLAMRQKSDVLNTLFFFVVVVTMVPLGIGPEPALLRDIAAGVVWVAALLAAILSLPRLFANDYADGTLEQMLLSAEPLQLIVLGKAAAHWLTTGLPLTVMAVAFGVVFDLNLKATLVLVVSLALGTPVLSLIGSIGAALTLGLRGGGVLTSLLVLPLYIPVLIFGAGAVGAAASGLDVTAYFLLLGALALFAVVLTPWAVAIALRISVE